MLIFVKLLPVVLAVAFGVCAVFRNRIYKQGE